MLDQLAIFVGGILVGIPLGVGFVLFCGIERGE